MVAGKRASPSKLQIQRLRQLSKLPLLQRQRLKGTILLRVYLRPPILVKISEDHGIIIHRGVSMAKVVLNAVQRAMPSYELALSSLRRIPGEVFALDYRSGLVPDLGKSRLPDAYTSHGLPLPKPYKLRPIPVVLPRSSPYLLSNRRNRSAYELYLPVNGSSYKAEYHWLTDCLIAAHSSDFGWLLLVGKRKTPRVLFYNGYSSIRLPNLPSRLQRAIFGCFTSNPYDPSCKILLVADQGDCLNIYRKETANLDPWMLDVVTLKHRVIFQAYVRVRDYFLWADETVGRIWWLRGWEDMRQRIDFGNRKGGNLLVRAKMLSCIQCHDTPYLLVMSRQNGQDIVQIFRVDVLGMVCTRLIPDLGGMNVYTVAYGSGLCHVPVPSFEQQQNIVYLSGWKDMDCSRFTYQLGADQAIEGLKFCHDVQSIYSSTSGEQESSSSCEEESGGEESDQGEGGEGGLADGGGDSEESEEEEEAGEEGDSEGSGGGSSAQGGGGEEGLPDGGGDTEEESDEESDESDEESRQENPYFNCNCQSVWFVKHELVSASVGDRLYYIFG